MNCRDSESLILAERDGVLAPTQHAALSDHVAACPACQQLRRGLAEAMAALQTETASVPLPDIEQEWRTLRAQLQGAPTRQETKPRLAPVVWFATPLAAAAALAFAFLTQSPDPKPQTAATIAQAATSPDQAGDDEASTMAYVDEESGWLVVWASDTGTSGSG